MMKRFWLRNESRHTEPIHFDWFKTSPVANRSPAVETLKKLIPIRNLGDDELSAFALGQELEVLSKDAILFEQGQAIESVFYLLDGTVVLKENGVPDQTLTSDSFRAKFPLSTGMTHSITVRAATQISLLRVPAQILEIGNSSYHAKKFTFQSPAEGDGLSTSTLFHSFYNQFCDQNIILPTLPNVAVKLRNAMKQDIGIADAVKIVQLDPAISAKIMQVANSPLYAPVAPVRSCLDAVKRIGLNALKNLVTSLSMKQIFQCDNKLIRQRMEQYWKQSIYLSSLCYLIDSKTKKIDPEQALLAGLVCDIGIVPFLNFAANFPSDLYEANEIEMAIPLVKTPVGVAILKKWGLSNELAEIPATSEDWFRNNGDQLTLSEIVVLAKLHSYIGKPQSQRLPLIQTIPAFAKLRQQSLNPESSLEILNIANSRVQKVANIFS
ncbi:MAG: HDOD domain-containing protein [Methylococcaceae bacterium]|nr:HDOD domain-containing protein [Methylococcaceae bacterium]